MCVCNSVCVSAFLFGTRLGSGLLQSHIPPTPLCSVLQKIFAFSTTHNFSSSIATRCGPCGPGPHGNGGSSSRGSFCGACPGSWHCCRPEGVGKECMSDRGVLKGPSSSFPRWPPGSSCVGGASQPRSCLAYRPQRLTSREASGKDWKPKVQEAPLHRGVPCRSGSGTPGSLPGQGEETPQERPG